MKFVVLLMLLLCLLCGCGSVAENVPEMEIQDIESMTDDELVMTVMEKLWPVVFSTKDAELGFCSLTDDQKLVFTVTYLDMEIANGGLCQFLVNDGGLVAPYVSDYLEQLGAREHQVLLDGFLKDNGIDVHDLSGFAFVSIEEFVDLYEQYPFDKFDDAYYELEPLSSLLAEFIRTHPGDFLP